MISSILLDVLAPILIMMGAGALLRWRFHIDLATLSKLNIYLLAPAFVFDKVSTSTLSWGEMGGVVTISLLQVITLGLFVWGIGWALRVKRQTLAAVVMAVIFYNSGNYGLPLAELAYPARSVGVSEYRSVEVNTSPLTPPRADTSTAPKDGGAVQAFVLMTQNVLGYTLGLAIAGFAHPSPSVQPMRNLWRILRLPVLPILIVALGARWWLQVDPSHTLPLAITKPAAYLSAALVPVALATLGAQLASNPRWPRWRPVSLVLVLRLLFGPVQMGLLLWGFHLLGWRVVNLWPWPAELLILTAAVPTAVTTMLLTLELEGDTDLAADCVFWTTVVSCATIPMWLAILRWYFG
ncbi:MAG TPA: AEC family transporter [Tepidisphaeraceae bacterium]|nr:AEC family transporter [Tepidisphaeraceae bacterium]